MLDAVNITRNPDTRSGPDTQADAVGHDEELQQYERNFLSLFWQQQSAKAIRAMAEAALMQRGSEIARFERHLAELGDHYRSLRRAGAEPSDPSPVLTGWDDVNLPALQREHGGLLVALFHFGAHRQIVCDLAVQGVRFAAPLAKRAYFDCAEIAAVATAASREAMHLIEVESPRVGRDLLQAIRAGRIALIYADGNMGPDGHSVREGAVEVSFLGRRIRVKEGLARLAQSLGHPVLPLLVLPSADAGIGRVHAGAVLHATSAAGADSAAAAAARQLMMQALYDHLAEQVTASPSAWEFAYCLHRWMVAEPKASTIASAAVASIDSERLTCPQHVSRLVRDGLEHWIDVRNQRAFRLPDWATGLHALLAPGPRERVEAIAWLAHREPRADRAEALLRGLELRGLLIAA